MTDPSSNSDHSPSLEDRQRWQSAMVLFEALQDLAPEVRDARLRADPPAADVLAMLRRMFAAIGETCVLDHPLSGALPGEADDVSDDGMASLAGRRLGRWLLLEPLGSGGMSTVWRVRSLAPPLGQIAALKLMRLGAASEAGRARFAREIEILAGLRHPGIAAVYDAGHAEDGTPWFAMALVEGDTIDAWCRRQSADVETRVDLVRQAAEAAAHAHRHLVVHRDIKPGNVMVDAAGRATLLDFGISRLLEEADGQASIAAAAGDDGRSARTYAFTPRYAAPEQLRGDALTTATDVYGLGALLHQLLLGVPPQWPEGADACRDPAQVGDALTRPALRAQLRGDLGAILRKALAAQPADRYPGAAELAADLSAWRQGLPVRARDGGPGYRLRRWAGRHRLAAALAVALACSLVVGAAGIVWQAQQARSEARTARAAEAEAARARDRAERQLARAETLNTFILDLFRANAPDRPPGELPTTAELLASGAARARDPSSAAPDVRAGMLVAIGRIHALRGRTVDADALAADAVTLAREARTATIDPADRAATDRTLVEALRLRAQTATRRDDFDAADTLLREAEAVLQAQPAPDKALLEVRRDRGMMLASRHRYAEAADLFAQVRREAAGRADTDPKFLRSLDGALAVSYSTLRRHADAQPAFARVLAARAANRESDGLRYAVALSNHGRNLAYLGDFAAAGRDLDAALALYDRLFDAPNPYRAAARLNRSQLYARQGRFDAALADADAASLEWAQADGEPLEQSAFLHANRLDALLLAERWEALAKQAAAARRKLLADPDDFRDTLVRAESLLAMAKCETGEAGEAAEGRDALQAARDRNAAATWTDPVVAAALEEAQARCAAAVGDTGAALAALRAAARFDRAHPPADAGEIARRERFGAALLGGLGRTAEASALRASAQARMRALAQPAGRPWVPPAP